jgi:WD40 repeat protein
MAGGVTDLSGPGVRVLVVGTATHHGLQLPALPVAARSAEAVARAMADVCGVGPDNLRLLIDPASPEELAAAIVTAADAAESVLLVYFVGHGLLDSADELHLATCRTGEPADGLIEYQALSIASIRRALGRCRAPAVVLMLDCCFSGRADLPALREVRAGFTPPSVAGAYVLASADRLAAAPEDAELTTFSGAFTDLLRNGVPRGPRQLTLDVVFDELRARLGAAGAPPPRQQSSDRSGALVLATNQARPEPEPDEPDEPDVDCPYLGLASFGAADADLYFGREPLVADLLERAAAAMRAGQPLMVVAPSGAGKTSLIHAGLLAALQRGVASTALAGSPAWPVVAMTPREHPRARLAEALPGADPASLLDAAREAAGDQRLVLVVDQLEQLFTLCRDPAERAEFLVAVAALAAEHHLVVMALRADFYAAAATRAELRPWLDQHQLLVPAMTTAQMRAAIEGPAALAGLRLADGLADVMLRDLGELGPGGPADEADSARLPLLSHALWATWLRRHRGALTVADYQAAGGIAAAIATSADDVVATLSDPARAALRRSLPRLVRVAENGPDTIRPVPPEELLGALPDRAAGEQALERLAAARLITLDRDSVRISHEALLRAWPTLRTWVDEDREWLRLHQRLTADATTWATAKDPALLYRGNRLAAALETAASGPDLAPGPAEFLRQSGRQEKRTARVRAAVISVLSTLLVLALAASVATVLLQRKTSDQRDAAVSRAASADAAELRNLQPGLAKQLSLAAYRLDESGGAEAVLASVGTPGQLDAKDSVYDLAQDSAGRVLVLSAGLSIALWDPAGGHELSRLSGLFSGPVAVSPDGGLLAAGVGPLSSNDPVTVGTAKLELPRPDVRLWNIRDPRHPVALAVLPTGQRSVTTVAFSPDGRRLAAGGTDGRIRLWDTADPGAPRSLPALAGHTGRVDTVVFAPHAPLLASSGADHTVRLWDLDAPAGSPALSRISASAKEIDAQTRVMQHRIAFDAGSHLTMVAGAVVVKGKTVYEIPQIIDVTDARAPRIVSEVSDQVAYTCQWINAVTAQAQQSPYTSCTGPRLEWWQPGETAATGRTRLTAISAMRSADRGANAEMGAILLRPAAATGPSVALVASANGVLLWDVTNPVRSGAVSTVSPTPEGFSLRLAFNPAGPPLMTDTSGRDGTVIYHLADPAHPRPVGDVLTTGTDGNIGQESGNGVAFRPDGAVLAVAQIKAEKPRVLLLSTGHPDGSPLGVVTDLANGASALSFSRDGRLLAVADRGAGPGEVKESARVFDVSDPAHPRLVTTLPALTNDLAFSPAAPILAVITSKDVQSWDLTDPSHPKSVGSWAFPVGTRLTAGLFTPDGTRLVVADDTPVLRIFRYGAGGPIGEPATVLTRAEFGNRQMAMSPDGRTVALPGPQSIGEDDKTIDLWDISRSGGPRRSMSLPVHVDPEPVAFSRDGRLLAVKSTAGVDFWPIKPSEVAATQCRLVGDPITRADWQTYLGDLPYDPPCAGH